MNLGTYLGFLQAQAQSLNPVCLNIQIIQSQIYLVRKQKQHALFGMC